MIALTTAVRGLRILAVGKWRKYIDAVSHQFHSVICHNGRPFLLEMFNGALPQG
jgi:hypothetical protein